VDKTGAGDAFNAGFITAYLNGINIEEAVKFSNLVASISITEVGGRSIPSINDVKGIKECKQWLL
jgi:sugar/nucleoside kinase (ribokinase family)